MAIEIDGVVLPDFPTGLIDDTYKNYIIIAAWISGEFAAFMVYSSIGEAAYAKEEGMDLGFFVTNPCTQKEAKCFAWRVADQSWHEDTTDYGGYIGMEGEMGTYRYELIYANHDVKTVTYMNDAGDEWTVGDEIYFPNSETPSEPEYGKIKRQIMRDIANAIRGKTGKTDEIKPSQMAGEIDGISGGSSIPSAEGVEF